MNYSLSTIRRGCRNLLTQRLTALETSKAGLYYKADVQQHLAAIDDLPPSVTSAPFKEELRLTDDRHDALGKVIHLVTEIAFVSPDVDPMIVAAAKQIREAFIPTLDELNSPYAAEGERALERQPLLTTFKAQLEMFRLPWSLTKTLHDVATDFINEGQKLDAILNQRADVPKGVRTRAATLRSKAMGTLNRLRKDVKKELERDPSLPRDLEQSIFGFFDMLHSMEAAGKSHEPIAGENEPTPLKP